MIKQHTNSNVFLKIKMGLHKFEVIVDFLSSTWLVHFYKDKIIHTDSNECIDVVARFTARFYNYNVWGKTSFKLFNFTSNQQLDSWNLDTFGCPKGQRTPTNQNWVLNRQIRPPLGQWNGLTKAPNSTPLKTCGLDIKPGLCQEIN